MYTINTYSIGVQNYKNKITSHARDGRAAASSGEVVSSGMQHYNGVVLNIDYTYTCRCALVISGARRRRAKPGRCSGGVGEAASSIHHIAHHPPGIEYKPSVSFVEFRSP